MVLPRQLSSHLSLNLSYLGHEVGNPRLSPQPCGQCLRPFLPPFIAPMQALNLLLCKLSLRLMLLPLLCAHVLTLLRFQEVRKLLHVFLKEQLILPCQVPLQHLMPMGPFLVQPMAKFHDELRELSLGTSTCCSHPWLLLAVLPMPHVAVVLTFELRPCAPVGPDVLHLVQPHLALLRKGFEHVLLGEMVLTGLIDLLANAVLHGHRQLKLPRFLIGLSPVGLLATHDPSPLAHRLHGPTSEPPILLAHLLLQPWQHVLMGCQAQLLPIKRQLPTPQHLTKSVFHASSRLLGRRTGRLMHAAVLREG